MIFIEGIDPGLNILIISLIVLVIICGLVFMGSFFAGIIVENSKDEAIAWSALGLSFFTGVIAFAIALVVSLGATFAKDNERRELILETYGINLSVEDYELLQYPDKEPTQDKSFGAVTLHETNSEGVPTVRDITLAWSDGEFKLYENESGSQILVEVAPLTQDF